MEKGADRQPSYLCSPDPGLGQISLFLFSAAVFYIDEKEALFL